MLKMYSHLYHLWTNPSAKVTDPPTFTKASNSGLLVHVGLFGDPLSEGKTWDPTLCTYDAIAWEKGAWQGVEGQWSVPENCGPMKNRYYNVYSIVPSSMSAQNSSVAGVDENGRGQLFPPDKAPLGCDDGWSGPCPAFSTAGIIMDPTSVGWLCAYPGDVASNTWDKLCPVDNATSTAGGHAHPFRALLRRKDPSWGMSDRTRDRTTRQESVRYLRPGHVFVSLH